MRIAFDIGGVLSKYPDIFRPMITALVAGGVKVFVLTDMTDKEDALHTLRLNGFVPPIPEDHIHCADFETYGEACKAVLLKQLSIDIFLDDFPAYLADGCPVRLLVQPDLTRPYYHDDWVTPGASTNFGRREKVANFLDVVNPPTILETFDCILSKIEGELAHLTLWSKEQKDTMYASYPVAELTSKGIEEGDQFIVRTIARGEATYVEIESIPQVELTEEELREIDASIHKFIPREDPGVEY